MRITKNRLRSSAYVVMVLCSFILISLLLSSCSLRRSNPLDPLGNSNIVTPDPVMNPTATASAAHATIKSVTLRWTANNPDNTDGYYIYRGLNYYSAFTLVGTVSNAENTTFVHSGPTVQAGSHFYWYKVSAYKTYPAGNLEGSRTDVAPVNIPE